MMLDNKKELEDRLNSLSDIEKDLLELWYLCSSQINGVIFNKDEESRLRIGRKIRDYANEIKAKYNNETTAYQCLIHYGSCLDGPR